ncbi:MAG: hypothetical protein HUU55_15905 [Myxococcales bacterium]|nr:hypothetical protein [Myxococcales bacterium]
MAITTKKRYGTKRNPETDPVAVAAQPDEVHERLEGVWELLRKYRYIVLGVVVGLALVALIGQIVTSMSRGKKLEQAKGFNEALAVFNGLVLEDTALQIQLPDTIKTYKSEEEKWKEALVKLESFTSQTSDSTLKGLADAAIGVSKYELGEIQASVDLVSAYLTANSNSPLAPALHQHLGVALRALGKRDEAASHFTKLTESSDWWFKTLGALYLGGLYDPNLTSEGASKEQAIAAYKAGQGAIGDDVKNLPAAGFLKSELEKRLAVLEAAP